MKLAYSLYTDAGGERAVLKKVVEQARLWLAQGVDVKLFVQWPDANIWHGLRQVPLQVFPPTRRLNRFSPRSFGVDQILQWKPDLVYLRFGTLFPAFDHLMRRVPTVLEVNTDDLAEYRLDRALPNYLYHCLTRGLALRRAAGLIFVTRELSNRPSFRRYNKPGLVLANGIDLDRYPQLPAPDNPSPRLVFIGSPGSPWHGVEKILTLARHFPDWHFDVIGHAAESVGNLANATYYGYLDRAHYEPIMAQADVALGSLAFHRIGISEASPLKVREYLAYGLPIILAYEDTDLPCEHPLILRLPNTPDNIESKFDTIAEFVNRVKGSRIDRVSIASIDLSHKEAQRLEFFARLVGHPC